mgnify:CR=1 FL=1
MLTDKEMEEMMKLRDRRKDDEAHAQFNEWYNSLSPEDKKQFDKFSKKRTALGIGCLVILFCLVGSCMFGGEKSSTKQDVPATQNTKADTPKEQSANAEEVQKQQQNEAEERANAALDKAVTATIEELKNKDNFPLVKDASIKVDREKKEVTMTLVVNNATNKKAALDLADTMIRRFSSNVVIHDSSFTMPSKDSYGSLFDSYNIAIGVASSQFVDNRSKWLYDQYIIKGMHTKQGPDWKKAK